MWLENLRQFVDRSLQRIRDWACGQNPLPIRHSREVTMPLDQAARSRDQSRTEEYVHLTYRFRSFQCEMSVQIIPATPGMKFIYRALQGSNDI